MKSNLLGMLRSRTQKRMDYVLIKVGINTTLVKKEVLRPNYQMTLFL